MCHSIQVALTSSGLSRGFAFIDMSTWQEAETVQSQCNGAVMSGHEIRVSFGMPCRPGACILQHKNTINIPFVSGVTWWGALSVSMCCVCVIRLMADLLALLYICARKRISLVAPWEILPSNHHHHYNSLYPP